MLVTSAGLSGNEGQGRIHGSAKAEVLPPARSVGGVATWARLRCLYGRGPDIAVLVWRGGARPPRMQIASSRARPSPGLRRRGDARQRADRDQAVDVLRVVSRLRP